jgi:hypothetical protein
MSQLDQKDDLASFLKYAATELEAFAKYIALVHEDPSRAGGKDHACLECVPNTDLPAHMVGFQCVYHRAKELAEGLASE